MQEQSAVDGHDIAAPPPPRRRRLANALIVGWLLVQIGLPASYYLRARSPDERFSWRMFSSVRMQRCGVKVIETQHTQQGPRQRLLALETVIHVGWINMLKRQRPAVVDRFLKARCDQPNVIAVAYRRRCVDPDGRTAPIERVDRVCATRRML